MHPRLRLAPFHSTGTGTHGDSSARNRSVVVGEEKTVRECTSGVSMAGGGRGFFSPHSVLTSEMGWGSSGAVRYRRRGITRGKESNDG